METSLNNTNTSGSTSSKKNASGSAGASSPSVSASTNSSTSSPSATPSSSVATQFLGDKVGGQVGEIVNKVKNIDVQEQMDMIRDRYDVAYDASASAIRANPLAYVAGAAVIGFLAGSLWSRK